MEKTKKLFGLIFATALIVLSMYGVMNALAAKKVKTVTISVPAAAFIDSNEPWIEVNLGEYVFSYAPLQLPEGAKITEIGFYVDDSVPGDVAFDKATMIIRKVSSADRTFISFGTVDSADGFNYNSVSITPSGPAIVDNTDGAYVLFLSMYAMAGPSGSFEFYSAHVTYEP